RGRYREGAGAGPPCVALCRRRRFRPAGIRIPGLPFLADRRAVPSGTGGRSARPLQGRLGLAQSLWIILGGYRPQDWHLVGQFPPDLFHGGPDPQRDAAEQELGGALLARVFIISNRVATPDSGLHAGGLEVVLKATLKNHPCVWMGWSGETGPHPRIRTLHKGNNTYIVSDLTEEDFDEYYNGFANRVLWPILHYRLDLAEFSRRDLSGYLRVNEHFADELAKVLKPDDIVWV